MNIKLLTEHHLEFLSQNGGCNGSYESTHVKMLHCWKSHVMAHLSLRLTIANGTSNLLSMLFFSVLFWFFTSQSVAMVMLRRSSHLITLFPGQAWPGRKPVLCVYTCNWWQPFLNQWKENNRRNYCMINLHRSIEPGRDQTRDPWIYSQTCICYGLHYAAWLFSRNNYCSHEVELFLVLSFSLPSSQVGQLTATFESMSTQSTAKLLRKMLIIIEDLTLVLMYYGIY